MVNMFLLEGRLVADPEFRYLPDGRTMATFRLAVAREDGVTADFITVTAWEGVAEAVGTHLAKGRHVLVRGHFHSRSRYENHVADKVDFLDRPKEVHNSGARPPKDL